MLQWRVALEYGITVYWDSIAPRCATVVLVLFSAESAPLVLPPGRIVGSSTSIYPVEAGFGHARVPHLLLSPCLLERVLAAWWTKDVLGLPVELEPEPEHCILSSGCPRARDPRQAKLRSRTNYPEAVDTLGRRIPESYTIVLRAHGAHAASYASPKSLFYSITPCSLG